MSKAKEIIAAFEDCKLKAYQDTAGIWTIGYGHTGRVLKGQTITQEQADLLLEADLETARQKAEKYVMVSLNPDEWAAVTSQAFNLKSYKKLIEHLNNSKELYKKKSLLYVYDVKKNKLPGLMIRRICERLLFEGREWRAVKTDLQRTPKVAYIEKVQKELFS
jgi:lysozyme